MLLPTLVGIFGMAGCLHDHEVFGGGEKRTRFEEAEASTSSVQIGAPRGKWRPAQKVRRPSVTRQKNGGVYPGGPRKNQPADIRCPYLAGHVFSRPDPPGASGVARESGRVSFGR